MAKVKTLADVRRLAPGTKLRLITSLIGPIPEHKQLRHVHAINSVDMILIPEYDPIVKSYARLPLASDFQATENGFKFYSRGGRSPDGSWDDNLRALCAEYTFV